MARRFTTEKFIIEANKMHNNEYDYSKSIYTGTSEKLIIICPTHGEFPQSAGSHLAGSGCPICAKL